MNLTAEQIAEAMGAEIVARGEASSPRRGIIDSSEAEAGDLFFGLRGERVDGGDFAPAAIAGGAWGVVVGQGCAAGLDRRLGLRRRRSARRAAGAGASLAPRDRRPGRRHHRLGRQDLGQGHRPGSAARPRPRQPREPQHRDRPAADPARSAPGDRAARAGDGDARPGADRRAGARSPSPGSA